MNRLARSLRSPLSRLHGSCQPSSPVWQVQAHLDEEGPSTSAPQTQRWLHSSPHAAHQRQHQHQNIGASLDPKEAAKFAALAGQWWDASGPFAPLHRLNPARCQFIRGVRCSVTNIDPLSAEPLAGMHVLDVGCGGGILSEAMARLGAHVHGIDVSDENVQVARQHAALDPLVQGRVRYERIPVEELAASTPGAYDIVMASEVLEHVKRPDDFIGALNTLMAPGATLIASTINRTAQSFGVAIVGAEYVTRMVPQGTHDWKKFITPDELQLMGGLHGLQMTHAAGMGVNLRTGLFGLTDDLSVNYIAAFHPKPQHAAYESSTSAAADSSHGSNVQA